MISVTHMYVNLQEIYSLLITRASKSPDLAADLPIFDIIMKISRFGMKISPFIKKATHLYTTTEEQLYGDEISFFIFVFIQCV